MIHFGVDTTESKQLEAELDRLNKYGIVNAVRNTVTTTAKEAQEHAKRNFPSKFTLRNQYISRSVIHERANQRNIADMEASFGSINEKLAEQEEGFQKKAEGQFGLAMPMPAAAGESSGKIRRRPVMRKNYLQNIKPVNAFGIANPVQKGGNKGNSNVAIAASIAIQEGHRVIFIDRRRDHWHRKTGFYRVLGSTKAAARKGGWPNGARLQLLYAVTKRFTRTKPHSWMKPAADLMRKKMPVFYFDELDKELRKSRLRKRS